MGSRHVSELHGPLGLVTGGLVDAEFPDCVVSTSVLVCSVFVESAVAGPGCKTKNVVVEVAVTSVKCKIFVVGCQKVLMSLSEACLNICKQPLVELGERDVGERVRRSGARRASLVLGEGLVGLKGIHKV